MHFNLTTLPTKQTLIDLLGPKKNRINALVLAGIAVILKSSFSILDQLESDTYLDIYNFSYYKGIALAFSCLPLLLVAHLSLRTLVSLLFFLLSSTCALYLMLLPSPSMTLQLNLALTYSLRFILNSTYSLLFLSILTLFSPLLRGKAFALILTLQTGFG